MKMKWVDRGNIDWNYLDVKMSYLLFIQMMKIYVLNKFGKA